MDSSIDADAEDGEEDVPGASLGGQDAVSLKISELKRWLLCRRGSLKSKKDDLVIRYGE